jgi:hypothetical protein
MGKLNGSGHDPSREGGVCVLTGVEYSTYVLNNTASDGIISKALQGLTALSNKLTKKSGINDPFY